MMRPRCEIMARLDIIIHTIKPLKAFLSLMRKRPSVDVILMCLMSMLNLEGQKPGVLRGKEPLKQNIIIKKIINNTSFFSPSFLWHLLSSRYNPVKRKEIPKQFHFQSAFFYRFRGNVSLSPGSALVIEIMLQLTITVHAM